MDNEGRVRGKSYDPSTASEIVSIVDSLNAVFQTKRDPSSLITYLSLDQLATNDAKSLNSMVQTVASVTKSVTYDAQKQAADTFILETNSLVSEKSVLVHDTHNVKAKLDFSISRTISTNTTFA